MNEECKKFIEDWVDKNFLLRKEKRQGIVDSIIVLVEKCIYIDNHAEDNMEHGTNE